MARAYVSLGSNVDRARHIQSAIAAMEDRYGRLVLSTVYESEAVGFDGANFYNLVVGFDTMDSPQAVAAWLRELEAAHGRRRGGRRYADRTLDADLLLFDERVIDENGLKLPRADILEYAFVLGPLAEIAPAARHPVIGEFFATLWARFDRGTQPMWVVDL
ncbi:MAG TPA: 2-amino-4-hydroxy-6-hydroxymethyldihydropteridine diphosphokinase [Gammaproteobacteria bacterium]|nr:2-amino-4-hydroxy-6-hydroxymethyldihydropteridine diphosphokinase [Gammaproteobacteria bacterium]